MMGFCIELAGGLLKKAGYIMDRISNTNELRDKIKYLLRGWVGGAGTFTAASR